MHFMLIRAFLQHLYFWIVTCRIDHTIVPNQNEQAGYRLLDVRPLRSKHLDGRDTGQDRLLTPEQ